MELAAAKFTDRAKDAIKSDAVKQATQVAKTIDLPVGWKSAWDPASHQHYYYHVDTKEVTWECPADTKMRNQEEPVPSSLSSASTTCSQSSTLASTPCSQASTRALEYVCVTS